MHGASRYAFCFETLKKEGRIAFMPFWMIGDPDLPESQKIIKLLAKYGDILELGIPFSDPLADGPTIQGACTRALKANTNTEKALALCATIRERYPEKPIGLLVYFNLILQFGIEAFFTHCQRAGIDSVLIPELPIEEADSLEGVAENAGVSLVYIISTNTQPHRIKRIAEKSKAFVYVTSKPSVTGAQKEIPPELPPFLASLKSQYRVPFCVGFGVSSPQHVEALKKAKADGAIIGSKLIDLYHSAGFSALESFLSDCRRATT